MERRLKKSSEKIRQAKAGGGGGGGGGGAMRGCGQTQRIALHTMNLSPKTVSVNRILKSLLPKASKRT